VLCVSAVKKIRWSAIIICFVVAPQFAQPLPNLPPIDVANFSPEIRESVRKAYAAAQARPRDAEIVGRLGLTLHTYEQHDAAMVCYERARQLAPQEFRWLDYLGLVQATVGKHAEAVVSWQAARQRQADHLLVQLRLADSLLALGQWSESQPLYEAVKKQDARLPQVHYGLGRIAAVQKHTKAAIEHFRQALLLFPRYGAAHYALGLALRDAGLAAEAQEHLRLSQTYKYIRPALDDPLLLALGALNASAATHLKRGVALGEDGKLAEAIAEHERALAVNSNFTQASINLIQLYGRAGQADKAEQHYKSLVARHPNLAEAHYNFGVLLTEQNRLAEAAQAFQRSLQLNPYHADSHHNYAVLIEREGKLDEAATHYRRALENNPAHRLSHFHLGRIFVHQNQLAAAIEHFRQSLTPEDEDTPRFLYALGATYARAGEKQKALEYLRAALQKAKAFGQTQLAASIERDLNTLSEMR
jgi:tetratricopeptide (TPR) repeat protein